MKSWLIAVLPRFLRPHWDRLESSPLGYRLAKGTFWSLMGAVLSRGLALGSSIVVARMIGKQAFGELGIIQTTVGMFGTLAGFGMGLTATKYVAEMRNKDPNRAGRIIALSSVITWLAGLFMAGVLVVFAPWVAKHSLAAPQLEGLLRVGSLLLLLGAVNGAQTGALSGFEAFKQIAQSNLLSGLIAFPVIVISAWRFGLDGAVCGLVVGQAANAILNCLALRTEASRNRVIVDYRACCQEFKVLWGFSLPALFSSLVSTPVYWGCTALLATRPGGYSEMGLFSAANQWMAALLFIPILLGQTILPILSQKMSDSDATNSRKILIMSIKLNAAIVVPLVIVGSLASPIIMGAYGAGFREAWPTLVVVLVTAGVSAMQNPIGQIIIASGRMWLNTAMNVSWAICLALFTLVMVQWGSFGLATARMLACVILAIWTAGFAYHSVIRRRIISV
ncbi:MAG: oligosaccharide flippase family protein [Verrucomicrobiota bacterium]